MFRPIKEKPSPALKILEEGNIVNTHQSWNRHEACDNGATAIRERRVHFHLHLHLHLHFHFHFNFIFISNFISISQITETQNLISLAMWKWFRKEAEAPPPVVLVPPLFDFPPLAARNRMLESSYDVVFGKLALKCLFNDYFQQPKHFITRIMLKPIDDPHVDLIATVTNLQRYWI